MESGDEGAMRNYLRQFPDLARLDKAREALLYAATNAGGVTPRGQPMRLRLYGWPLYVEPPNAVSVPVRLSLVDDRSQNMVRMRLRELWASVINNVPGSEERQLVLPPMLVEAESQYACRVAPLGRCMKVAVDLLQGKTTTAPFNLVDQPQTVIRSPGRPLVVIAPVVVAWPAVESAPLLQPTHAQLESFCSLLGGYICTNPPPARMLAGQPLPWAEAVTAAQSIQVVNAMAYGDKLGRQMAVHTQEHQSGAVYTGAPWDDVAFSVRHYTEEDTETPMQEVHWQYEGLWRPSSHIKRVLSPLWGDQTGAPVVHRHRLLPQPGAALH